MSNERNRRHRPLRRWFGIAFLFGALAIAAPALLVQLRSSRSVSPAASPLVGAWTLEDPLKGGTTRTLTFLPNGRFTSVQRRASSGAILYSYSGSWHVEGEQVEGATLVIRQDLEGLASLLSLVSSAARNEDRIPIGAASQNHLSFGTSDASVTYRRVINEPPSAEP